MPRYVRLQELLVGVAGLALLRSLYDGSDEAAAARLVDVRRGLDDELLRAGEVTSEAGAQAGYAAWSDSYDEPGNPIVALEEPAVRSLVEELPPGRGCVEPALSESHVAAKRRAFRHLPEATVQAYAGLPAVLVWDIEKGP